MNNVGLKIIDNVLPLSLLKEVHDDISNIEYSFGWKSNRQSDPHGHWNKKIIQSSKKDTKDFRNKLDHKRYPGCVKWLEWITKNVTGKNNLLRFYVNGHTYGVDGYPHTDSKRKERNEQTFVMYMTPGWKPEWAGETVIFNRQGNEIEQSVLPKFGRILTFPSQRLHAARSVSRICNTLRLTLVCKVGESDESSSRVT